MFGILNLNKPPGVTSRDVVDRVQEVVRPLKVGHAGTLDPLATGVLVVCVGPATRLVEYIQRMPKRYRGTFLLGCESDTEDVEGDVRQIAGAPRPTREEVQAALPAFVGRIQQRPPVFSAVKLHGRRAYKLARAGRQIELEPRPVEVHALEIVAYEYPRLTLEILCGSGTYVRSLGRDLARCLGSGAVLAELERTAVGEFRIEDAVPPEAVRGDNVEQLLLPPRLAVAELPQIVVGPQEIARLARGQEIRREGTGAGDAFAAGAPSAPGRLEAAAEIAALDAAGNLIAIVAPRGPGALGPSRLFVSGP